MISVRERVCHSVLGLWTVVCVCAYVRVLTLFSEIRCMTCIGTQTQFPSIEGSRTPSTTAHTSLCSSSSFHFSINFLTYPLSF